MTFEAEAEKTVVQPAWFIFLDVRGDPLRIWTGPMNITLSGQSDTPLNGEWLASSGLVEIGEIVDDENGSGPTTLSMSGVDPGEPGFKQIIADGRLWRLRKGIIWLSYMNDQGELAFTPRRKKTGRMDDLRMLQDESSSQIMLNLEGFAARAAEALGTRYSEQRDVDPTDTSQDYAADLANRQPPIGDPDAARNRGGGGTGGGRNSSMSLR